MKLLVIDGNSLMNRAFYGIKLLSAKDGHYTNAIYGFMNMFLSLLEQTGADSAAVAFDLKAPTFRHKMYDLYKSGRKPMPAELFEQMDPVKKLLTAYGAHIIEKEGYEADDILGTLSRACGEEDFCYIATGDRDSLQLVNNNVSVLLTTTKMGRTETKEYTPAVLFDEYGLTPDGMIELKALQGDTSDKIPGVAGIGPKTAGELIRKYGTIEYIFSHLDEIDVSAGVRTKLEKDKENAFLSKTLGTICCDVPIDTNLGDYKLIKTDRVTFTRELARHEMFRLIKKLGLDTAVTEKKEDNPSEFKINVKSVSAFEFFFEMTACKELYLSISSSENGNCSAAFLKNDSVLFCEDVSCEQLILQLSALKDVKIFAVHSKEIHKQAFSYGCEIIPDIFDPLIAGYLLNPNSSEYTCDSLCLEYGIPRPVLAAEDGISAFAKDTAAGAASLKPLCARLLSVLEQNNQTDLFFSVELPLAKVLASMETDGMLIDTRAIEDYSVVLQQKTDELEQSVYEKCGEKFNINSPKQLGVILFEKLGLPSGKKTKTGYSTNADVLEKLAEKYPVVNDILEYRTFAKLKSTYCDGLIKAVASDGRVHCTFNQTETRTGRLSSSEPNLQNIPVRTQTGREFRKFFIAPENKLIVDADYSQIELRVLAALSGDGNMISAFNSGDDIHTVTASKVFGIPENEVTKELRTKAKAVNFGIVYGIGAFSLAADIKSTRKEAEAFINAYLALYSGVDRYMKESIVNAKQLGYCETLFHRRRLLPELSNSNAVIRAFGERVARNMPIQGTAADIIKIAMVNVYKRLRKELPETRLIMQVHDELILEAPESDSEKASAILKEEMENAVKLGVKFSADVSCGKTWYEAKT